MSQSYESQLWGSASALPISATAAPIARHVLRFVFLAIALTTVLSAEVQTREKVQITKTEQVDFPAGGSLRLINSTGDLNIESWSEPRVEITTIKSSRAEYPASEREEITERLQRVTVTVERNGNQLVITSDFPRHDFFLPSFGSGANLLQHHTVGFDLLYRIRVPRNTRILLNHDVGRVFIDGVTSDIEATLRGGDLLLHLPQEAQYTIDAKADAGHVNSDYPGEQKGRLWRIGHEIVTQGPPSSHKLNLRVGFGDIIILKTQTPEAPPPLASVPTERGQ